MPIDLVKPVINLKGESSMPLRPIPHTKTCVEQIIDQIEGEIFNGYYEVGAPLPSERQMAEDLQVSRSSVHQAIKELVSLGLIIQKPRSANYVADYTKKGDLTTLNAIIHYHDKNYTPKLLKDIFATRQLIEQEILQNILLNSNHNFTEIDESLTALLAQKTPEKQAQALAQFYHSLAQEADSMVLMMLLNNFQPLYLTLGKWLFVEGEFNIITDYLKQMVTALKSKKIHVAVQLNNSLIEHSLTRLLKH